MRASTGLPAAKAWISPRLRTFSVMNAAHLMVRNMELSRVKLRTLPVGVCGWAPYSMARWGYASTFESAKSMQAGIKPSCYSLINAWFRHGYLISTTFWFDGISPWLQTVPGNVEAV